MQRIVVNAEHPDDTAIAAAADSAALARVTQLSANQVCEGYRWALEQQGAEPLRGLFERALKNLES